MDKPDWDSAKFLHCIEDWLKEQRLLELRTGQPLLKAFFVRLDEDGKVEKVIASGSGR